MDPLSIAVSILALSKATTKTIKWAKILYGMSKDAGPLAEEVKFFAFHINIFGTTISHAHTTIREHHLKCEDSSTLRTYAKQNVLKMLATQSENLVRRLETLHPRSEKYTTFMGRLKWFLKKEKRDGLLLWVERVKTSFLLVTQQIMLEDLQQRARQPRLAESGLFNFETEIMNQKKLLGNHVQAIIVLRQRASRRRTFSVQQLSVEDDPNDDLYKVEEFIIDTQNSSGRHPLSDASRSPAWINVKPPPSGPSSFVPPSPPFWMTPDFPFGPAATPTRHPMHFLEGTNTDGHSSESFDEPSPSNSSVSSASIVSGFEAHLDDNQDEYMAVEPSKAMLTFDATFNGNVLQAYINANRHPTHAIINTSLSQNIISQRLAVTLGLEIESYYDRSHLNDAIGEAQESSIEEEVPLQKVDFGHGRVEDVIGIVHLAWKKQVGKNVVNNSRMVLKLTCLVCERVPVKPPLIFGQAFLNRRDYYWGGGEDT